MINMSTPYADMHREFWQEYDKQEYWINKWQKQNASTMRNAVEKALRTESKLIDRVEYNKQQGNRWINYIYAQPIVNRRTALEYHSVCYWEGYGSFGTFSAYRCNGEKLLLISTTHYWQRYCERTKAAMHGVHTAMDFYAQHPSCHTEILPPTDGDTRRQICIHYTCGAAYGVEVSEEFHIFELRTFIANETMTGQKARDHKAVIADMDSDNVNKGLTQIQSILKQNSNMLIGEAMEHVSREYHDETFMRIVNKEEKTIRDSMAELRKTMPHEQAVEKCLKLPIFEGSEFSDEMLHFHIATLDTLNNEESADNGFKTFIATVEDDIGESLPTNNKRLFQHVYADGFDVGADVMKEYIALMAGVDPRFKNQQLKPLQEFKHEEYVKMKAYYEKEYASESKEIIYAVTMSNARGFDDGMKHVAAMVERYLGLNIINIQQ